MRTLLIYLLLVITLSAKDNATESFWNWFGANHEQYRSLDCAPNKEQLLDDLLERLHRYDNALYFEVSEPLDDGSNELIITTEGNRVKFPKVDAFVKAAPKLPNWEIFAFKQPQGFTFIHQYGEIKLDLRQLWFLPLKSKSDPSVLGLRIGMTSFDKGKEDETKKILWIILDTGLGEKICAERIQRLEVVELPEKPEDAGFIELPELPDYIEWSDKQSADKAEGKDGSQ